MTNAGKVKLGVGLVVAALALVVLGFVLRGNAADDAERRELVAGYTQAISGRRVTAEGADQTPATIAWVAAGASLLTGVIFLAGSQSPD